MLIGILASVLILLCNAGARKKASSVSAAEAVPAAERVGFIYYADTFLVLDENGVVCENTSVRPGDIPEIAGVDFKSLIYGKKAVPEDETALSYVYKVAFSLDKHGIEPDQIRYDSRMITVQLGRLEIRLGKNDKTEDKINDLNDFIDKIAGADGVLYMQNANANNYGYTFRAN